MLIQNKSLIPKLGILLTLSSSSLLNINFRISYLVNLSAIRSSHNILALSSIKPNLAAQYPLVLFYIPISIILKTSGIFNFSTIFLITFNESTTLIFLELQLELDFNSYKTTYGLLLAY